MVFHPTPCALDEAKDALLGKKPCIDLDTVSHSPFICSFNQSRATLIVSIVTDLPQILVPHVKLEFCHFLFLNSGTPLALENDNSRNYVA